MSMRDRSENLLDGIFEGFSDKLSYYIGILLILCGWFKASKKWILGFGIIFLIFGNTKTKMDKKLEALCHEIISFMTWLSIKINPF